MTQQPIIRLAAGDLVMEIAAPGSSDEHAGTRFSPVAHLLQIQYRGHSYLFRRGSPMEFDIGERTCPPGFDGCAPGESFVKIGVGLLERDSNDPYSFTHLYPVRVRPATTMTAERSSAGFIQRLEPSDTPFGYELAVNLRLEDNMMTAEYALGNLGAAYFETEQYLHNFCCFDGAPLSPDYTVAIDYDFVLCNSAGVRLEQPATDLVRHIDGRTFGFDPSAPEQRAKVFFRPVGIEHCQRLSIGHDGIGTGMTIEADQPPGVNALYVTGEQISLEMNVTVGVEPGATVRWTRRYTFQDL